MDKQRWLVLSVQALAFITRKYVHVFYGQLPYDTVFNYSKPKKQTNKQTNKQKTYNQEFQSKTMC